MSAGTGVSPAGAQRDPAAPSAPFSRLRLFQKFSTFRILVCGGDGSVGWVLSEIDALGLHKQVSGGRGTKGATGTMGTTGMMGTMGCHLPSSSRGDSWAEGLPPPRPHPMEAMGMCPRWRPLQH